MLPVPAQQRAGAFLVGLASGGGLYLVAKRTLWASTRDLAASLPNPPPPPPPLPPVEEGTDPLFGRAARADARAAWNRGVDAVFQPIILALSRRGW